MDTNYNRVAATHLTASRKLIKQMQTEIAHPSIDKALSPISAGNLRDSLNHLDEMVDRAMLTIINEAWVGGRA